MIPETRYSRSPDGVHIAYQVLGGGDLDLVVSLGFVSHLEHSWEEPHLARFLQRLASFSRLIVFDKRGTGMSDRQPNDQAPLLEDRVSDIASLMDTVGSERAAIMGLSETGAAALLFAATYPGRTTAVVAYGGSHRGVRADRGEGRRQRGGHRIRVGALAEAGEILVSRTVTDLVVGSDLRFVPRGRRELKGVPGEWELYAVA